MQTLPSSRSYYRGWNKPSEIVCSETWMKTSSDLCRIEGYSLYFNKQLINKSNGVAVFVRNHFNYTIKKMK